MSFTGDALYTGELAVKTVNRSTKYNDKNICPICLIAITLGVVIARLLMVSVVLVSQHRQGMDSAEANCFIAASNCPHEIHNEEMSELGPVFSIVFVVFRYQIDYMKKLIIHPSCVVAISY